MARTTKWAFAPTGARAGAGPHPALVGRPRVRKESPLWAPRHGGETDRTRAPVPFAADTPFKPYQELDVTLDAGAGILWCHMRPKGRPSFTPTLLRELIALRRALQARYGRTADGVTPRYFVGGSRLPRIFSLGGDLAFFAEKIRARDRAALLHYAHDCVDVGYHMATGFNLPIITIALVQGDALGGGFEGALSFNVIVAERSARFGLPEILFNLFPGMGAYSFLARRLDATQAERMILSGRIYTAEELHAMGLIDRLADDGAGEAAVRDYIAEHARHHAVQRSLRQVRQRIVPLTLRELKDVAAIWADHALRLDAADLRRMERLMQAQNRRLAGNGAAL